MTATIRSHGPWVAIGTLGAIALAIVSIERGEDVNALWIVVAAVADLSDRLPLLQPVHRQERHAARPGAADAGRAPQ